MRAWRAYGGAMDCIPCPLTPTRFHGRQLPFFFRLFNGNRTLRGFEKETQAAAGTRSGKVMPASWRWHDAQWPGVTSRKAGTSCRQRAMA